MAFQFASVLVLVCLAFLDELLASPRGVGMEKPSRSLATSTRGPVGWPLLGTLPQMGTLAHRKLADAAALLGATRLMAFSLGTTRVIISSHPDTAWEILSGPSFSDRPIKESARSLMFERAIEPLRQRVADEMAAEVQKGMEDKGFVELRGILLKGSLSNILESVFGDCIIDKEELGLTVKEGYELITMFNWEDYFPLGFLDIHGVKRCRKLSDKVRNVVGQIVKERQKCGADQIKNGGNGFLSALPREEHLSDSDMTSVLWEMIFRGTDTVAILLEWIMARMVMHQDIQAKVQQEIGVVIGDRRGHIQDSDLSNLPYLQAVVKEVLRMHPPGPLFSWARLATHDVHVGKTFIPKGTTAMVNMWAITHDPSIWRDPWTFRPERFIEEEDVPIMGSDLRLAPFVSGRRVCPGKALGLTTVQLWLARLLHDFKWLPTTQHVDLSETLRLSLEMKKPLTCRVVPRQTHST